ncbi:MAG: hypothetical protein A2091_08250 [Desulfuromonadales bacterium GWD2_61_12]|nr:MAG: hypothetical protein A2005_08645 [Desulfuromonadales bacterium GWC2_61_20]OGR33687.1 MAG: hypothetical protein A2091_08250 [Desulfuromonadales bacterium GWD2_61_12]HAD03255.1 hypothetical protein [Desulfuromonas sp.]HBT83768.1 hypothetical protein [Desulfuromonas sp.]
MQPRTIIFENDTELRRLLCTVLRGRGHEVLDYASPVACALVAEQRCRCPRDMPCADIILTDLRMPGMTGLELLRLQRELGCKALPQNKAVISAQLSQEQHNELSLLGCHCIAKPFHIRALLNWVESCEARIVESRILTGRETIYLMAEQASAV